jgi:hypothetical protein
MSTEWQRGEIFVGDGWVELTLGESVYKLDLDVNRLPEFPQSVTQELPPYLPSMVEEMLREMKIRHINHCEIRVRVASQHLVH